MRLLHALLISRSEFEDMFVDLLLDELSDK